MWQFSQVIDGITRACEELDVPITGGNVSFYNETLGEGIYPTPVLGVVGILEDERKAVRPDFREAGRAIVLLRASEPGDAIDAAFEFGSSEYAKEILGELWGYPPQLELKGEAALQKAVLELAQAGVLDSAHDCSEGGVAVALSECCFQNGVGAKIELSSSDLTAVCVLFGEDASRIVISCDTLISRIGPAGEADLLGETVPDVLEIKLDNKVVISAPVSLLHGAYEGSLQKALSTEPDLATMSSG